MGVRCLYPLPIFSVSLPLPSLPLSRQPRNVNTGSRSKGAPVPLARCTVLYLVIRVESYAADARLVIANVPTKPLVFINSSREASSNQTDRSHFAFRWIRVLCGCQPQQQQPRDPTAQRIILDTSPSPLPPFPPPAVSPCLSPSLPTPELHASVLHAPSEISEHIFHDAFPPLP